MAGLLARSIFTIVMNVRVVASRKWLSKSSDLSRARRKKYRKLIAYRVRSIRFANSLEKYSITTRFRERSVLVAVIFHIERPFLAYGDCADCGHVSIWLIESIWPYVGYWQKRETMRPIKRPRRWSFDRWFCTGWPFWRFGKLRVWHVAMLDQLELEIKDKETKHKICLNKIGLISLFYF